MIDEVLNLLAAILVFLAALLAVAGAVGIIRFADVLTRLHAVTKPQVLGLVFIIIAVSLVNRSWLTFLMLLPVFIFQALTAPIAAHMVARAAYRADGMDKDTIYKDELAPSIARVDAEESETGDGE